MLLRTVLGLRVVSGLMAIRVMTRFVILVVLAMMLGVCVMLLAVGMTE